MLSNRPPSARSGDQAARHVLVADRFPDAETGAFGRVDAVGAGAAASRIEAGRRAPIGRRSRRTGVTIVYREDDGPLDRARALAIARRPPSRPRAHGDRPRPRRPVAGGARARRVPAAGRAGGHAEPVSTDPSVQAAARRLGRLAGRGHLRRGGWREMLTQQAQSSNRATATGSQGDQGDHPPKAVSDGRGFAGPDARRRSVRVHARLRPRAVRRAGACGRVGAAGHEPVRLRRRAGARRLRRPGAVLPPGPRRARITCPADCRSSSRTPATCARCGGWRPSAADVVHFQWLAMPWLDVGLLPDGPLVLTAHDLLPREPKPGQARAQLRLLQRDRRGRRPFAIRPWATGLPAQSARRTRST